MRTHKVGTLTLGLMLIFFGVLFLVHLFTGVLSYNLIFNLWPVVFLSLGAEVLLSMLPKTQSKFSFDVASIVLLLVLMLFAMAMAGVDTAYQIAQDRPWIWY